jgi:type I restriction enzyme S subunit
MTVRRVAIETLYHGLYDGPHATPKPSEDGPVFLGIGNITEDGKLDLTDVRHIAEEDYPSWTKRVTPQPGDIVFTYEATLNRYAIIPEGFRGCLGRRTALIRSNPDAVNSRFLFFYFFSEDWRNTINENILSGATVDRIPLTRFPTFSVTLPERAVQDRIASILSAYDDLIENNTRRIKILEEMAQMLYREWFANFRFPGHQKVKMVESELGPIPKGWTVRRLRDVTSYISRGISPTYDESAAGWVINQKCIRDRRLNLAPARKQSKPVPPEKALRKGDILINSTGVGTLGRVAQVHQGLVNFTADSHVSIVRPTRHADYLGEVALQLEPSFEAMGVGSTGQTELGRERLAETLFVCPPDSLQARYAEYAQGIHQLSLCLLQKNENLRTTRDLLLPKLISGEISVDAAGRCAADGITLVDQHD